MKLKPLPELTQNIRLCKLGTIHKRLEKLRVTDQTVYCAIVKVFTPPKFRK